MAKDLVEKELELIFPTTDVEIAGHVFELRPFSFVETRVAAMKLKEVLHLMEDGVDLDKIAEIYSKGGEGVRDVIAMCLDIKPATVDKFDMKSTATAIVNIIKINKDFFVEQVETEVSDLVETLGMQDNSPSEK